MSNPTPSDNNHNMNKYRTSTILTVKYTILTNKKERMKLDFMDEKWSQEQSKIRGGVAVY